MKPILKLNHSSWIFAFLGMLFLSLSVNAMEPDTMKMDGGKEKMMQSGQMRADEMIMKGEEMMTRGKEMKEKGKMMKKKEMKKGGMMKEEGMMKEKEMKGDKMDDMKMKEMEK